MAKAKPSLTQIQRIAVDRLNAISKPGRRGSGARQAKQRGAVRKWYEAQALRLGYTPKQIVMQYQDVIDMAFLEATAIENPTRKVRCTSCEQTFHEDSECPMCRAGVGLKARVNPRKPENVALFSALKDRDRFKLSRGGVTFEKVKSSSGNYVMNVRTKKVGMLSADRAVIVVKSRKNPGFFTTTRQRKPKDKNEDYLGRAANPQVELKDATASQLQSAYRVLVMASTAFGIDKADNAQRLDLVKAEMKRRGIKPAKKKRNPFFSKETERAAKPVTKIRTVRHRDTGQAGEIVAVLKGNWLKVQWQGRAKPTLIKRSEVVRMKNPHPDDNKDNREAYSAGYRDGYAGNTARLPARFASKVGLLGSYREGYAAGVAQAKRDSRPKKRRNPSVTELAETFQGRANGNVSEFKAADSAPANLARIGKLVFLKLVNVGTVKAPGAMVAVDTRGRLWIVANRTPLFATKVEPGTLADYGEVKTICYLTAKAHVGNGKAFEYVHEFGEDGGKRPRLLIDSEGMPILRGGDYKIKAEGIVN